jgi:hypothetical protein
LKSIEIKKIEKIEEKEKGKTFVYLILFSDLVCGGGGGDGWSVT